MKNILFVDDEPFVLQGLQRMLRPFRDEWEMTFVESGAKALEHMAQTSVDVVVSDMCMPGMNGAELLNLVMKRSPKTVRLILSGHADKELILKCVGSTHQYLSKPCNPEMLKTTIRRVSSIETSFQNEKLQSLVTQIDRLPSIPELYLKLVKLLENPDSDIDEVGKIIANDIGMTMTILKLVNSAFFGISRDINTTTEAVSYLGLDTIRSLVLTVNTFSQFDMAKVQNFSLDALLSHSLQTATIAKAIAQAEGVDEKFTDEAFTAGMLHDTGKLVLAAHFTAQFNRAVQLASEEKTPQDIAETQIFGVNHATVGGYLLNLWGLPTPVIEAITLHHAPGQTTDKTFSLLTIVHVADGLAHELTSTEPSQTAGRIDNAYLTELGLLDRLEVWRESAHKN